MDDIHPLSEVSVSTALKISCNSSRKESKAWKIAIKKKKIKKKKVAQAANQSID